MTRKITAIGYGRVSTSGGTGAQANAIRNYAAARGMDLVAYHFDEGVSGASLQRPGLQAVIRDVEEGRAKVVIVEGIDRLGRNEEHLRYIEKLFSRNGVVLHTLSRADAIADLVVSFHGI